MEQSIFLHPMFENVYDDPANWTMNALPYGSEEILQTSWEILGNTTSFNVTSYSFPSINATFNSISNDTSDVNYLTSDESYTIQEKKTFRITPNLPCSISGSTLITFRRVNYMKSSVPDWISVDSSTGAMTIVAPAVSETTVYNFYINSLMCSNTEPILKLIRLTVLKCSASHCQKCIETDGSICEVCDTGYILNSGAWDIHLHSSPDIDRTSL